MPIQKTSKEEILRNCIRLFRKQGYYRTSMADLSKETGMTKGVFYHYFSSKEQIMQTALDSSTSWFDSKVFSLAYQEKLSPMQKIDTMLQFALRAFSDEQGGCFFANTIIETAHVEETFVPQLKIFFKKWQDAFAVILKSIQPNADANALAQQFIIEIEGSLILMQLYEDKKILENTISRIRERINLL